MAVQLRLARTDFEFVQISNGHAGPLGPGIKLGK